MYEAVRRYFVAQDFDEVETPCLVPVPGMEPHISAFETRFVPEMGAQGSRALYLHTSPEYAMKRLLADGFKRIFQIARVFRNGEVAAHHNPEFTMLEFYRADCDYHAIMEDLQALIPQIAKAVTGSTLIGLGDGQVESATDFERVTFRDAILRRTGIDIGRCPDEAALRAAANERGVPLPETTRGRDDLLLQLLLDHVEPTLGRASPTFLTEYPASMASLARLKPEDSTVAERFELYLAGVELANGFSELNDVIEQRRRLVAEQALRRQMGRPTYSLDENFLDALRRLPSSAGVAVGLDRLLMLLLGAKHIDDVLLFPASMFFGPSKFP
jgi:elongation factor P--(R)-beta-lysine ligase